MQLYIFLRHLWKVLEQFIVLSFADLLKRSHIVCLFYSQENPTARKQFTVGLKTSLRTSQRIKEWDIVWVVRSKVVLSRLTKVNIWKMNTHLLCTFNEVTWFILYIWSFLINGLKFTISGQQWKYLYTVDPWITPGVCVTFLILSAASQSHEVFQFLIWLSRVSLV